MPAHHHVNYNTSLRKRSWALKSKKKPNTRDNAATFSRPQLGFKILVHHRHSKLQHICIYTVTPAQLEKWCRTTRRDLLTRLELRYRQEKWRNLKRPRWLWTGQSRLGIYRKCLNSPNHDGRTTSWLLLVV